MNVERNRADTRKISPVQSLCTVVAFVTHASPQGCCRPINILYLLINECDLKFCCSEGIWLVFTIFIFMRNKGQNGTQVKLITVTY